MSKIEWDNIEEEKIEIKGNKKLGKVTATMGDLKIVARAKMSRKERINYTRATVSKLDMEAMSSEGGVKLKEGFGIEDMITSQMELDILFEGMLYEKASKGKSEFSIDEDFLENNSDFNELRAELIVALKEFNGLVGKSQEIKTEE